jgi:hypothetical protein
MLHDALRNSRCIGLRTGHLTVRQLVQPLKRLQFARDVTPGDLTPQIQGYHMFEIPIRSPTQGSANRVTRYEAVFLHRITEIPTSNLGLKTGSTD